MNAILSSIPHTQPHSNFPETTYSSFKIIQLKPSPLEVFPDSSFPHFLTGKSDQSLFCVPHTNSHHCLVLYLLIYINISFYQSYTLRTEIPSVYTVIPQHSTCVLSRLQSYPTMCDHKDCSLPGSCLRDSSGKNTRVGCHSLLQGIFLTQGLNPGRLILYCLNHQGSSGMQHRAYLAICLKRFDGKKIHAIWPISFHK